MDTQMKKGVLEMCILFRLRKDKLYGYELMKAVREHFPDVYEGSVYAILRRLKADGYTEKTLEPSSTGPARKYYEITYNGKQYLNQMVEEWKTIIRSVESFGIM